LSDDTFKGNYAILVGAAQNDGTYKVACISNILKTEEAPVVYVPIKADASLEKGQALEAAVNKIDLSKEGNVAATLNDLAYNALSRALGDLNADQSVDGQDVTVLYDDILNGTIRENNPVLPDVNEDGAIDGQDATTIYNIILGE
jgi:DNA-binding protein Fis